MWHPSPLFLFVIRAIHREGNSRTSERYDTRMEDVIGITVASGTDEQVVLYRGYMWFADWDKRSTCTHVFHQKDLVPYLNDHTHAPRCPACHPPSPSSIGNGEEEPGAKRARGFPVPMAQTNVPSLAASVVTMVLRTLETAAETKSFMQVDDEFKRIFWTHALPRDHAVDAAIRSGDMAHLETFIARPDALVEPRHMNAALEEGSDPRAAMIVFVRLSDGQQLATIGAVLDAPNAAPMGFDQLCRWARAVRGKFVNDGAALQWTTKTPGHANAAKRRRRLEELGVRLIEALGRRISALRHATRTSNHNEVEMGIHVALTSTLEVFGEYQPHWSTGMDFEIRLTREIAGLIASLGDAEPFQRALLDFFFLDVATRHVRNYANLASASTHDDQTLDRLLLYVNNMLHERELRAGIRVQPSYLKYYMHHFKLTPGTPDPGARYYERLMRFCLLSRLTINTDFFVDVYKLGRHHGLRSDTYIPDRVRAFATAFVQQSKVEHARFVEWKMQKMVYSWAVPE
jgi:hypothetical protein